MKNLFFILFLLFLFSIFSCATPETGASKNRKISAENNQVSEEHARGDFSLDLETIEGESFSFDAIRGKKHLLIAFWASWCDPCKTELENLRDIYPSYSSDVEFVAVATDTEENFATVQEQVVRMMLPYPVLTDPSGNTVQSMIPGGDTVPYSMIVSKNGKVVFTHEGYKPGDEIKLKQKLDKLISE
ncbi:MAG: TlpA disulfide reductase family protein [bacterium]